MPPVEKETTIGPKNESLAAAVENVSTYVQNICREVHLDIDDDQTEGSVTIIDSATGRTIREIPPQEVLEMSRHISARTSNPITGLLIQKKA